MTDEYIDYATTLDPSDAPAAERLDGTESKRNQISRLARTNTLKWNGKWRNERRETSENGAAVVESIAGQLELTPYQQSRALNIYDSLDDSFDTAYATSLLAMVICGHVGREDGRDYHPNQIRPGTEPDADETFVSLTNELEIGYTELYSCWRRIGREL
jgi:hypothetical protein